jgi:hypothetical protein
LNLFRRQERAHELPPTLTARDFFSGIQTKRLQQPVKRGHVATAWGIGAKRYGGDSSDVTQQR